MRFEVILDSRGPVADRAPIHGRLEAPETADFDFVIIADRTGGAAYRMFEKGLDVAASLEPRFLLSVGDLVEGYWSDAAEAEVEWDAIDAELDRIGLPILLTVGNHDYGTQTMIDVWRRRKGADYYAVRYGPALFLMTNSEAEVNFSDFVPEALLRWNRYNIKYPRQHTAIADRVHRGHAEAARLYPDLFDGRGEYIVEAWAEPEEIEFIETFDVALAESEAFRDPANLVSPAFNEKQIDFFERVLAEHADAAWTCVSMHQPAWKKPDPHFARLEAMLASRPFTLVAGHTHFLDVETRNDRHYIAMGKTGGLGCYKGAGDIHHVMLVKIRDGAPQFEIVRYEDMIQRSPIAEFQAR